jgi:hypothetical protein
MTLVAWYAYREGVKESGSDSLGFAIHPIQRGML